MKRLLKGHIFLAVGFAALALLPSCTQRERMESESAGDAMEENVQARYDWERQMLADPATGRIPDQIRAKELAFAATLPSARPSAHYKDGSLWRSRGPWNVGGRTRALAIDISNENIILAAGVSGGIWRSTDGGGSWTKVTKPNQLSNISCLVQDTRPGRTRIWYAGTGEFIGNSASGNASFLVGDGILKSTDGGLTWNSLASTVTGRPQSIAMGFDIVNNIAINTADTGDIIYAATYGSVYRSTNGGTSWTKVRGAITPATGSAYTDVTVSPKGVVYAALSSDGSQKGIWRSVDGIGWTNITPSGFASQFDQISLTIDPTNEANVYLVGSTPGYGKKSLDFRGIADWASLWKYTYLSGNGSGTGGQWIDRSQNLPSFGGDFGNFNTQGGYNMFIRIKPDDPNTLFLGSTNLWRSTDAFSTPDNITWIGGYDVNTSRPAYKLYPNQHPDQHNLVFFPSNPKAMIAACDGGIDKTTDNTAANVSWASLNHGYLTSQFYTVAIDHATPYDDEILGGLQDNGSFFTRTSNPQTDWTMPGNGDGSFCAIADGRADYYVSSQLGKTYHVKIDNNGNSVEWGRVDPKGSLVSQFINPFVLDPNNQKRMYFVAKNHIWKNDDVTRIPTHPVLDTNAVTTGWSWLAAQNDTGPRISSISISRKPADRLYYGTVTGKIFRIDNASGSVNSSVSVTSSLFPAGAYVNNICIDPDNADHIIVVFSNYNVQSLFYSADGGRTFTAVSGNLEQYANGTGNGPSCRWAAIMPVGNKHAYFVATSTGLYATDTLKGSNTVWTLQDPDGLGNTVCTMIETRPADGLVVVATHGAGVYSANISNSYQVTAVDESDEQQAGLADIKLYPNPMSSLGRLSIELPEPQHISIDILDENGRIVQNIKDGQLGAGMSSFSIRNEGWRSGMYYCRISTPEGTVTKVLIVK